MLIDWFSSTKKSKRQDRKRIDVVAEQVRGILQKADQKIILMVRQ